MNRWRFVRRGAVFSATALLLASVAACGSGSDSSAASSAGNQAAVTEAKAAIAPFVAQPSAFPVTEPLPKQLPAGTKFGFFNCGTPGCTLATKSFRAAVDAIGGSFTEVPAGTTAATSQAAASTMMSLKPDVAFLVGDPALYGDGLKKLSQAGVLVMTISVVKDIAPYGVTFNYIGAEQIEKDGRLLANWVIAREGADTDVVFYTVQAFDYSTFMDKAFIDEMKKKCPACKVRTVPIDIATMGTTSANTVVADLQAHPDSKVAVFATLQIAQGLPAAMSSAGLKDITTVGRGPSPANLQDLKTGGLTASLTTDLNVSGWITTDAAARLLLGGQPTANEKAGAMIEQFLDKDDITFDPTNGWFGYPDYKERFAKLWLTTD